MNTKLKLISLLILGFVVGLVLLCYVCCTQTYANTEVVIRSNDDRVEEVRNIINSNLEID